MAFLKLRAEWSEMVTRFMKENRASLDKVKGRYAEEDSVYIAPAPTEPEGPIQIFTDGACKPNPGKGGWGAIVRYPGKPDVELSGHAAHTTNNKMELTGAVMALQSLPGSGLKVILTTDSQYLRNAMIQWLPNWKKNGWRTADKQPVKNADLWRELDSLNRKHKVKWEWTPGHAGHPENERCDQLANEAILKL